MNIKTKRIALTLLSLGLLLALLGTSIAPAGFDASMVNIARADTLLSIRQQSNVIKNGDFEAGSNGDWTEFSFQGWDLLYLFGASTFPRSGAWVAWLGGDNDEIASLSQTITVPASRAYLVYWYKIGSDESSGDCHYDTAYVLIDGTPKQTYGLCADTEETTVWQQGKFYLGPYAGETIEISFYIETDVSNISSFYVDDVSIEFESLPSTGVLDSNDAGWFPSLTLDNNDYPYISYTTDRLTTWCHAPLCGRYVKYIYWNGTTWAAPQTVTDSVGEYAYSSIGVKTDGQPLVSYYDATLQDFCLINYIGGFKDETCLPGDSLASTDTGFQSLAVDSDNDEHFAYYGGIGSVYYYDGNGSTVVAAGSSATHKGEYGLSLTLHQDRPYIAFRSSTQDEPGSPLYHTNLGYIYKQINGDWSTPQYVYSVNSRRQENFMDVSLAIDSNGNPHLSFRTTGDDLNIGSPQYSAGLAYAHKNSSGDWVVEGVDSGEQNGWHSSIAIDSQGHVHISYSDKTGLGPGGDDMGVLKYAYYNGSQWQKYTLDNQGVLWYTSMALDSHDVAHIAYADISNYQNNNTKLKYITFTMNPSGSNPSGNVFLPLILR